MSGPADDDDDATMPSFPTYAELTQTQAWAGALPPGAPIATATAKAAEATETRYAESAVLGTGGMGKVMLARDARIGREVAVKVMHADRELDAEERERFLREAQVQGQLEHPSIVPVYDIDQRPDGSTFFTMRRVLGRTLQQILDDERKGESKYTQRELLQAFATVCLTIDYAHTRGVVHRDLKPANIMLGDFGEVYVLDWGLAKILDGSETSGLPANRLSMPGAMLGTPLYMAPEQMADPDVGPAADVYSLGAMLFEILTLQRVRDARALYAPVDARTSVRAPTRNIAPELEQICVRATQMLVADRYASARVLQEAVAAYLEGDRELAHRRQLAETHAKAAREALSKAEAPGADYEIERGAAMRELVRALALEPTNQEHVAMLAEVMEKPPRTVPPEVETQLRVEAQEVVRGGSKYTATAMLSWFLFFPVIWAAGLRRVDYVILIAVAALATAALAFYASRLRTVSRSIQYVMFATMMVAGIGLSRIFGPLILMPTMLTTWAIVLQAHPDRRMRMYGLAVSVAGLLLPVGLELAGVLPSSYAFENGLMHVMPQMTDLPHDVSIAFLTVANVGMAVLPAAFIGKLRDDLARAQTRERVQSWHFRRLGDDLLRATG